MRTITRLIVPAAYASAVFALILLSVNIFGETKTLRSDLVTNDPSDFSHDTIIGPDEAWRRLDTLDISDRRQFALEANLIIGQAMKHVSIEGTVADGGLVKEYNLTIPFWENYFLYVFRYLKPSTYLNYELSGFRRAIERGIGQCGQQTMALIGFLEEHGFNTGFVHLNGHVAATAEVSPGEWYILDPDYGVSIPHSLEELENNQELVETYYHKFIDQNPWQMYGVKPELNEITYGGAKMRYPRGSRIEEVVYAAKWIFPALLLLFALGGLSARAWSARGQAPASGATQSYGDA